MNIFTNKGKALLCGLVLAALPGTAWATSSSTSHDLKVETQVVSPLGVSTGSSLNFGDIVAGATAGTVVISTGGARSTTGGVALAAGSTTPAAGVINLSGSGTAAFTVSFSSGATLAKSDDQTKTMTVDTYVMKVGAGSDQTSSYAGSLTAGAAALTIGATLHVGTSTNTPNGSYATDHTGGTPLTVTVTYN